GPGAFPPGHGHACASLSNGSYACWGNNASGQVSSSAGSNVFTPFTLTPPSGYSFVDIVAGFTHSCAILQATSSQATPQRRVQCWGAEPGAMGGGFAMGA